MATLWRALLFIHSQEKWHKPGFITERRTRGCLNSELCPFKGVLWRPRVLVPVLVLISIRALAFTVSTMTVKGKMFMLTYGWTGQKSTTRWSHVVKKKRKNHGLLQWSHVNSSLPSVWSFLTRRCFSVCGFKLSNMSDLWPLQRQGHGQAGGNRAVPIHLFSWDLSMCTQKTNSVEKTTNVLHFVEVENLVIDKS